mgnify:CR=1 FL=1
MKQKSFREYLLERESIGLPLFFDGGMGTMIQSSLVSDYDIPEDLNITNSPIIAGIHEKYLAAGANVITANTFGANPLKNEGRFPVAELISAGVTLVRQAIDHFEASDEEYAKSAHFAAWDTGQIGKLLEPMGELTFDEAYESYKTASVIAEKAGADLAIIETMSDLYEVKAAVLAVKENTKLPIVASMTFQSNLRTLTGADVLTCSTYLESLGVDVLGFNCGGSLAEDEELARQFTAFSHIPVLAQPNAGLPVVENGRSVFKVLPSAFAASQAKNRLEGVCALGGCCGTTPAHIAEMVKTIRTLHADGKDEISQTKNNRTFVCSGNKTVEIGGEAGPVIVGERINPTGKKKCKEALLSGDMQFVLNEAEAQINAGAQVLDVNVGLPGIDEAETMVRAVKTIQAAFNTPLQIDSSEPPVLEKALRYYNGKALVNSVNGKAETMAKVFPLVKKYGGAVVALCIDEDGIAPTAMGRVAVADKMIREAATYGILPRDIFIDTLTLTVSSQQKEALETLKAIEILHQKYDGLQFILGVSNISFGLPRRDIVNSRFLAMALQSGLTACIINPLSEPMMDSYRAFRALAGFDENCLSYIETYSAQTAQNSKNAIDSAKSAEIVSALSAAASAISRAAVLAGAQALPAFSAQEKQDALSQNHAEPQKTQENAPSAEKQKLIDIICKGFKDEAAKITAELLQTLQPVEIIDGCIVPALDAVGKDFERGKKFLPQLLLSADTVSRSFSVIKEMLSASGSAEESKGTIAIATVEGDIHDIGKNIVKAMLENYGYTVIDLGKNVSAETIVQTVIDGEIRLLGLSALMTTTVANMEKTIKLLRKELSKRGRDCKVMAGGAVLTEDYAKKIGADYYAKDAMASVNIAKEVFAK